MNQIIEITIFVVVTVCFFALIYSYLSLSARYRNLLAAFTQTQVEKEIYKEKLTEYISQKETKKVEETEGFVRFISQSRDMAFTYIEDVQKAIAELKDYFDKNGLNLSVEQAEEMANKIENVISHLPEESKND